MSNAREDRISAMRQRLAEGRSQAEKRLEAFSLAPAITVKNPTFNFGGVDPEKLSAILARLSEKREASAAAETGLLTPGRTPAAPPRPKEALLS